MTKLIPRTWIEMSDNFCEISYLKIIFMVSHKTRVQVKLSKMSHCVIAILSLSDIIEFLCSRHEINPHIISFVTMYNTLGREMALMKNNSRNTKNSPRYANYLAEKNVNITEK